MQRAKTTTTLPKSAAAGFRAAGGAPHLGAIALLAAAGSASAYDPVTPLGRLGQTELQQQTGDTVNIVCPQLGELPSRSAAQQDLFDRCGNMVGNAFVLEGLTGGPTDKSLGLTATELANAVQTVANEELASTRTMAAEISGSQSSSALARLHAVRSGVRFGLASLSIDGLDGEIAGLQPAAPALAGATGGGAGDALLGKWGFFFNGHYGFGDRDGTEREDAFDYDRWGLTAGADYRLTDDLVLGGMVTYGNIDSDFDKTPAVAGGGIDADAWGIGLYGTWYKDQFYIDGLIGYNQTDYDIDRAILLPVGSNPGTGSAVQETARTATASTESSDFTLSLGGGMDFSQGNLSYGPFVRLTYLQSDIDGYRETGAFGLNLTVDDQDWESFTSALGARVSASLSQSWGVLVPQARLAWVHEFQNDATTFTAFYSVDPRRNPLIAISDEPAEDYAELGIGVSAVMSGGVQAFFDYQTLLGHEYLTDHVFSIGIRKAY
jgi:outer membrane autotransporter protein